MLSVEREELGITAGLQDRVVQVYEGLVYMDFGAERERIVHGLRVLPLRAARSGAAAAALSSPTIAGSASRPRCFTTTSASVSTAATRRWSTVCGVSPTWRHPRASALLDRDAGRLSRARSTRTSTSAAHIFTLPAWQVQMVDAARACGASANFAGSGGAIVGTYDDERTFERLQDALLAVGSRVIKPQIVDRS